MTIEIGQTAPDMKLVNDSGEEVALTDFKGKYVVLYFYPKDMTPGCTTEACDFRDQHESFAGLDAVIIGVSPDSRDKHEKFKQKHDLPFQLLVDDEHKLAEAFDVWKLKKNLGKNIWVSSDPLFVRQRRPSCEGVEEGKSERSRCRGASRIGTNCV